MPQSLAQVSLHLVFSAKDRRPLLIDEPFPIEMFSMLAHHDKDAECVSASVGGHIERCPFKISFVNCVRVMRSKSMNDTCGLESHKRPDLRP
jgi:putative transposase